MGLAHCAAGAGSRVQRKVTVCVFVKENEALFEELRAVVAQAVNAMERVERRDRELLYERMRFAVRRFVNQRFQRKPVILPMILEIDGPGPSRSVEA